MTFLPGSLGIDRKPVITKLAALAAMLLTLGACSGEKKDKPASQVAAKVNKEEISVHQVNHLLLQQQQQAALRPEQAASASRQALERLIDQELVLQKAAEARVEREAAVLQAIDAARREIISRAYLEKLGEQAAKPRAEEIHQYYESKPDLFSARRIYSFQELAIEASPQQLETLRAQLKSVKTIADFAAYLRVNDIRFSSNQAVRAAEQLPLNHLGQIAKLKEGESMFTPTPTGAQVLLLVNSRSQPVSEERASPVIEQFLLKERKRKLADEEVKTLRTGAKIEYVGEFARAASSSPAGAAVAVTPESPASAGLDIDKGLKGFK